MALHQRLLRDIAEMQTKPYPNISLFPRDDDVNKACLILTPNGGNALHLTVTFGTFYPLKPPKISIQSHIYHPNVFGPYICASILNTEEGYTPAYTLKGIAIQLLSFFSSDSLEQDYGGYQDLTAYRNWVSPGGTVRVHHCMYCGFDSAGMIRGSYAEDFPKLSASAKRRRAHAARLRAVKESEALHQSTLPKNSKAVKNIASLPDEILILVCNSLETEELLVFARAWERIGGEHGITGKFNLIRNRELLCFCLKKSFQEAKLGVGVNVKMRGRQGTFESEFDLLSLEAYNSFDIRRSVQGLSFTSWLPLPISRKHYASVHSEIQTALAKLSREARLASPSPVNVIYHFMNDVVVKLSTQVSSDSWEQSSLQHASEKAMESYFHLFHLLLCLAIENDSIVRATNRKLHGVLKGHVSKEEIPNLGHLLIAVLISDIEMTPELMMAIIRETVTRNVVWMLDAKGKNMAELVYMEADSISEYRLQKTFDAGTTSYRLLMFLNLFRKTINRRGGGGLSRKTLTELRDDLFDAHGAPPLGTAAKLAADVKRLQQVDSFPKFIRNMDLTVPAASQFTTFLRGCVESSMQKRYSVWNISQTRALTMRRLRDPSVQVRHDVKPEWQGSGTAGRSFFPNLRDRDGGRWQGGRGGGRGRGYER